MNTDDDTDNRRDPSKYSDPGIWASFAVPGLVVAYMLGSVALGLLAGHFIDIALRSTPIATFIGLLLGLAAGVFLIVRRVSSLE
jgi:F0F1-type ATP synthase assembly protein I